MRVLVACASTGSIAPAACEKRFPGGQPQLAPQFGGKPIDLQAVGRDELQPDFAFGATGAAPGKHRFLAAGRSLKVEGNLGRDGAVRDVRGGT